MARTHHPASRRSYLTGAVAVVTGLLVTLGVAGSPALAAGAHRARRGTYASMAAQAVRTLERGYYEGGGRWNLCDPRRCSTATRDWGADSLTYTLYFHWQLTGDPRVEPIMNALTASATTYTPATRAWSDKPLWDAVADAREYQVTGNPAALAKAESAFDFVAVDDLAQFAEGACPSIYYQQPGGGGNKLKTLETGSNYIKAALLLYQITHDASYLQQAQAQYAAVRQYFLDPTVPLYTVYVFDNGTTCTPLPGRFFASVNGNMIWDGLALWQATGTQSYLQQAVATARAVRKHLADAAGVYADLQAGNDVSEPLIEAMYDLATTGQRRFARTWLLTAAHAASSDVSRYGTYGRFFDGPPPRAPATAWQSAGGLALAEAAGTLDPRGHPARPGFWRHASFVRDHLELAGRASSVRFSFTGRAVAIIGTLGEHCCQSGHARVFIDGTETFDQTGIWQDKSSARIAIPDTVLFAWRWPRRGHHTIVIRRGIPNAKEGVSFFHMTGYDLVK